MNLLSKDPSQLKNMTGSAASGTFYFTPADAKNLTGIASGTGYFQGSFILDFQVSPARLLDVIFVGPAGRLVPVINEKKYKDPEELKNAILEALEIEPGLDELEIAKRLGVDLRTASLAVDELLAEMKIETEIG